MKKFKLGFISVLALSIALMSSPVFADTYGSRTIDFDNWSSWTDYNSSEVNADFGNYKALQGGDRLKINANGNLRFFLPQGSVGSSQGGGIIKAEIDEKSNYNLEYDIKFSNDFPWSKGGKIPGLSGGEGYTGCQDPSDGKGFSIRMMWKQDGKIQPYVYHMNQTTNCGDNFDGTVLDTFNDGQWYNIRYWVKMNDPGLDNGILKIYVDNVLKFEKRDLELRSSTQYKIDTAHFSIFPGGSSSSWEMTDDGYIYIDNVSWY